MAETAGEKQSDIGPGFGDAGMRKQGRPYLTNQTVQETVRTAALRRAYREQKISPEVGVFLQLYQELNQNRDVQTQFNSTYRIFR